MSSGGGIRSGSGRKLLSPRSRLVLTYYPRKYTNLSEHAKKKKPETVYGKLTGLAS